MRNRSTFLIMFLLAVFALPNAFAAETDKVPVAIFKFNEGPLDWTVRNFPTLGTGVDKWYWRENGYKSMPGGAWFTNNVNGESTDVRNTMVYSPEIDLANKDEVELYINAIDAYGQPSNNKFWMYVQTTDSLDLNITEDTLFIQQWSALKIDLDFRNNYANLGISSTSWKYPNDNMNFCGPLNLAMFSGRKVRIALHFWNENNESANYKNIGVSEITLAALTDDTTAPVGSIEKVDSVGNTFMRAWYNADEVAKVYWAVMPKGQSPASFEDLKAKLGTDAYVNSGTFNFNVPGMQKAFFFDGLEMDTEYTITYGVEDYKNNVAALQTKDQKTISDLVAPVVSKLEVSDVTEITATLNLQADELGNIHYRIYEAGLEPEDFDQFMAATGSVKRGYIPFDTIAVDEDWLIEYLDLNTDYVAYATVTDMTGNVSDIFKSDYFKTLADEKAPVIDEVSVTDITTHAAKLNLTADEPRDGFGGAVCYWSVTATDKTLSSDDVLNRVSAMASGMANLDSATYLNLIVLDNLAKGTEYKVHAVVVDGSENVSEPKSVAFTTDNQIEEVPAFMQEFNVENQNYHFVEVVKLEGQDADHWENKNSEVKNGNIGGVKVLNRGADKAIWQEAWCMVGPIDLTGLTDITLQSEYVNGWGNYEDHLTLWISKKYKGDGVMEPTDWEKVSQPGDFPTVKNQWNDKQFVVDNELKMDTAGVYVGFKYFHNAWAHNWTIYSLEAFGTTGSTPPVPIIDWVEAEGLSSTSAKMTFTSDKYGRAFYYLIKDDGAEVTPPTMEKAISGEGADAFGYVDYTAGNFIDQIYTIGNLEPSTKYHIFTTFRSLHYAWAEEVFYDDESCIFETSSLAMSTCEKVNELATTVSFKTAAESAGRIHYTVKPAGSDAPQDYEELINSFDKKGSTRYDITDGTEMEWEIGGLVPLTSYDVYIALSDMGNEYASEIKKIEITTGNLAVTGVVAGDSLRVNDTTFMYNIMFEVDASSKGKLYMLMTAADAAVPTVDMIMAAEEENDTLPRVSVDIADTSEILVNAENLYPSQAGEYEAWFVLKSGNYYSKIFALNQTLTYTYALEFKITDINGKPLPGVNVKVGQLETMTNTKGQAYLDELQAGDYQYEIIKGNYTEGGSVTIAENDEKVEIKVVEKYDLSFTVKDNLGNLQEGVSVKIGEDTKTTGADGMVTFSAMEVGSYDYTIDRKGDEKTGTSAIVDNNLNVDIVYDVTAIDDAVASVCKMYPNPASGMVNLELANNAQVSILDINGRAIENHKMNSGKNKLNLSDYAKGLYFVSIKAENGESITLKLVVK